MNSLIKNNPGLMLVDAGIRAMGHDPETYLQDHNDGDFTPEEPKPPVMLEMRLFIRMDECADPKAFRRDMTATAAELMERWNRGASAWEKRNGLDLDAEVQGECTGYEVHPVDPENY